MDNLNLEKFNPTKTELLALADDARKLVINGIEDKAGYELVHTKRMELKKARVEIAKTGKAVREEALAFQKKVIAYEKELIGIIEPVEADLEAKQKAIDDAKLIEERKALMPERIAKLEAIEAVYSEDDILKMDGTEFQTFLNIANHEFLTAKEARIKAEQEAKDAEIKAAQDKLKAEQDALAEAKRVEEAKKQAIKDAQEKAIRDAELAKIRAEEEKAAAVQAEKDRQAAEEKAKKEAENARIAKEKAEQDALEKKKKYQNFLDKHGYKDDGSFKIERVGNKVVIYKKLGELTI